MLLKLSQTGEFETVALPHLRDLYRTAARLLGDNAKAEGVVQETYLQALKSFARFDPGTNCRAWLFKILVNTVHHHRRNWFKLRRAAPVPERPAQQEILRALDRLPPDYRAAALLADVEEFCYKEIAGMLEVPIGTVMSRLSRGRKLLREQLSELARRPMNTGAACDKLRGHLDGYLSRELSQETSREVERHLENCSQCAAELETRARIRAQLQAAVRATPVPANLEAKVRRVLNAKVSRPRTGLWAVAAAAAVIVCVALVGLLRERANPEQAILRRTSGHLAAVLNVGLRDHLHCAVFRKYSKQPVAARQMDADLGPEFAALVPLVQAKLPRDFRVIQGHRCIAGGRQYTHLIISGGAGGGKLISLVVTRKLSSESLSGGIYQTGVDRFKVVRFESYD